MRWEDSGPPDIGNQTAKAFGYLSRNPEDLSLPEAPRAQGNGAVMRAAAHGVMAPSPAEAADNAWAEAGLTHPSWEARSSSALVAALVALLVEGHTPRDALEASWPLVESRDEPGKSAREVFRTSEDVAEAYVEDPGRTGWTVYTTRLGLLCLQEATDFRSGIERIVRLAGDADTNGAVAGALLGAQFGAREIPVEWLDSLRGKEELLALVQARC